jgi:copper chaperone CopZ
VRNVSLLLGGKFPNSGLAEMVDVTREFGVEMHCGKCEETVTRALKVCYFFGCILMWGTPKKMRAVNNLSFERVRLQAVDGVAWVQVDLEKKIVQAHGKIPGDGELRAKD